MKQNSNRFSFFASGSAMYACIVLICLVTTRAVAQMPVEGPPMASGPQMPTAQEELKELTKKLKLTDEQKTRVEVVLVEKHRQMDAAMKDESLSIEERIRDVKATIRNSNASLRVLLTEEQQTQFDKLATEKERQMVPVDGPRDGGPPPNAPDLERLIRTIKAAFRLVSNVLMRGAYYIQPSDEPCGSLPATSHPA
jgi:protein CpxP